MRIPARIQSVLVLISLSIFGVVWLIAITDLSGASQREKELFLAAHLHSVLPDYFENFTPEQEQAAVGVIKEISSLPATAELDFQRLNFVYAWMGTEQHLARFPGDRLTWKDELLRAGLAPGRGAFGYFAPSKDMLTWEDFLREKYYIAVQTLYLDTWDEEWLWLKEWYKFRKVVVVNPTNGRVVVAVIGDAGPAKFTGKQFGGSPEVMKHLDLYKGPMKGLVLLLFVDESEGEVPLGPVKF
jgi:hypothetical protein